MAFFCDDVHVHAERRGEEELGILVVGFAFFGRNVQSIGKTKEGKLSKIHPEGEDFSGPSDERGECFCFQDKFQHFLIYMY